MTALTTLTAVVGTLTATVLLVAGRFVTSLRRLNDQIAQVNHELRAWQHAHDHHVAELHRRLTGIEQAAARAEAEARGVSDLLVALNANERPREVRT